MIILIGFMFCVLLQLYTVILLVRTDIYSRKLFYLSVCLFLKLQANIKTISERKKSFNDVQIVSVDSSVEIKNLKNCKYFFNYIYNTAFV